MRANGTPGNGGNCILILGDDGYYYYYAHLDSFNCQVGDTVEAGQVIGATGNTGVTGGPHLHLTVGTPAKGTGVWVGGKECSPVNPEERLQELGVDFRYR